jgi:hypothetical protein
MLPNVARYNESMPGQTKLPQVLSSLRVSCDGVKYGFASVGVTAIAHSERILGTFQESEGLTLIAREEYFKDQGMAHEGPFAKLTIEVHTSLELVGLTSILATQLANHEIPANVIAAFYHDHIFVPYAVRAKALGVIEQLGQDPKPG